MVPTRSNIILYIIFSSSLTLYIGKAIIVCDMLIC